MAKRQLGAIPSGSTDLMRKQDVDAVAYYMTIDDTAPTPLRFGHRWIRPSTGVESVWVPTTVGSGAWVAPAGVGDTIDPSEYLKNTTDTFTGTLTMAGSIIPSADITYDLGSPTKMWRDLYVGPGSIYMNGKKILEDDSDTIVFSTDVNQNVRMEVTGTGNVEIKSNGGGAILMQGTINVATGKKIIASDGNKVEFGDDIDVGVNKVTSSAVPSGANDLTNKTYVDSKTTGDSTIVRTSGDQTVNGNKTFGGNMVVSGNLTVNGTTTTVHSETVTIDDNIIELNSNFTSGSPTENSGFQVRRGDLGVVQWIWDETNDVFTGVDGSNVTQSIKVNAITATTYNGLTKSSVGLSNVDNTSDANKPVSTAQQTALDLKAPKDTPTFTGLANFNGGVRFNGGYTVYGSASQQAVATIGDGAQTAGSGNARLHLNKNGASAYNVLGGLQNGVTRWEVYLGDGNGAFSVSRFNASGTWLDQPFQIAASDGTIFLNKYVSMAAGIGGAGNVTTTGTVQGGYVTSTGNVNTAGTFTAYGGAGMYYYNTGPALVSQGISGDSSYWNQCIHQGNPNWGTMNLYTSHQPGQWAGYRFIYPDAQKEIQFRTDGSCYNNAGWFTFSDERLKTNKVRITGAWDKLDFIGGWTFDREDLWDDQFPETKRRRGGGLAQEWQKAIPEAVTPNGEFLTVDAQAQIGFLTEALKDMKAHILELQAEIKALKGQ